MHRQEIVLADMSCCRPSDMLSPIARPGHWQLVNYVADEISGKMLLARQETRAPQVVLPLSAQGWHAIHLGYTGWSWAGRPLLRVKLSRDPCFVQVEEEPGLDHRYLEDAFWKMADLTGQDLIIAQRNTGEPRYSNLAYVRLVPSTEEDVERLKERRGTRRLIALNDGGFCSAKGACSVQDIQEEVEPYRDTDFGKLFWQVWMGDTAEYPTQVGAMFGEGLEDFGGPGDRRMATCFQEMKQTGVDPLQVVVEHAHGIGVELHASMRMGLFGMHPPADAYEGPFFRQHPEFRCRDHDGTEVSHLSYAFPEVREYVLSLLKDSAGYDIDGVNLIFLRGQPYVLYEQPLVEGFRRETGVDPAALAREELDAQWYERNWGGPKFALPTKEEAAQQRIGHLDELSTPVQDWLRYRAQPLTEFMRGLRAVLDRIGRGQRVSAVVFINEADNLFYGLDLETWVKEGLVDILIVYPWPEGFDIDMPFFRRITGGTACEVYPNVMPRQMLPVEYLQKAVAYYEQGADGLAFWDTNSRHPHLSQWRVVRELGHMRQLKQWLETERFAARFLPLRQLGGYTVDRYHPDSGG